MSSTAVLGFIKDITAKKVKAVEDRLKKEKPNQKYIDPSQQNLVYSLLHKAVSVGSPEIVLLLLKAGADVNSKDSRGKSPLHWLASLTLDAHFKIAEILLKSKDIDIQAQSDSKATPLHEAAAAGNVRFLQLLLSKGATATDISPGYSPVHATCQSCSGQACLAVADVLLLQAPDLLRHQDASGFTPLMRLLQRGAWDDARELLSRGDCNINAEGTEGETALLLACSSSTPDLKLVSALLTAGASAAVQDKASGNTPLILAIKLGGSKGLELAKLLLSTGPPTADACSVNTTNKAGESAISLAAKAVLERPSSAGGGAAAVDALAAIDLLGKVLERQPQVPDDLARSLLQTGLAGALSDGITAQLVSVLPEDVVSQAATAAKVPLPLTFTGLLSMKLYKTAVIQLVKTTGQDPGAPQDAAGNTHLHKAVSGPDDLPDLVAALVAVGVPPNAVNKDGDTALHIAAKAGHVGACRALVEGGADVTWRNAKNRTASQLLKLPESTKAYLKEAEEAARLRKAEQTHQLWDPKIAATQTMSACVVQQV